MDQFPRKPLMDRVIVREIPIEEFYETSAMVSTELLDDARVNAQSDRGEVVAVGTMANEVVVGDLVYYDPEFRYDPVYLNPAHRNRTDLPKYWQIRMADLKSIDVERRNELVQAWEETNKMTLVSGLPILLHSRP